MTETILPLPHKESLVKQELYRIKYQQTGLNPHKTSECFALQPKKKAVATPFHQL